MFTQRERAALKRMGKTLMIEECGPAHVVYGEVIEGRRPTLCGAMGCLTHSAYPEVLSLSDIRLGFVKVCAKCHATLGPPVRLPEGRAGRGTERRSSWRLTEVGKTGPRGVPS